MKRVETFILAAAFLVMLLSGGCSSEQPKFRIGVSQCSDDDWRSQMNDEIRREALFHDNAEVEIRISNDDNAKQIEDIEYFINHNFDILIVSPREAKALTPVIRKAYEKGIPVIVFDRAIDGEYYTSYMKLDNEGVGRAAAQYVVQSVKGKEGKIIELRGLDDSSPAIDRHNGFRDGIDSMDHIRVVASVPAFWKQEAAFNAMDSLLTMHPDVNVVYAHNDLMAIGAARAVRKHKLSGVKVIGTDAVPALGIKAVADSLIDATFVYPTEGDRVLRTALAILNGEHFERVDMVPAHIAVDSTNAEILMRQNQLLTDRTRKIEVMNARNTLMQSRHRTQQYLLIATGIAAILLVMVIIFLIRYLNQRRRYEKILTDTNEELSRERDRQNELYSQLEEATRSKLVFFTNVSHDLRTPITLISEPISQVAQADYLTPAHRSMMQLAMRNLRILKRMIEQILDFRQYQNGKMDLNCEELCPVRYIREWADAFQAIAAKRHIRFSIIIDADENASAAVDIEKLERIFFNIVSNAFKYTADSGSITVRFSMNPRDLVISVTDTGIGISEEDAKHIFDRFYRVDKVHPTGSGIGLSLTKAFVEVMGGEINVESAPGKGSVFTVILPIKHIEKHSEPKNSIVNTDADFEQDVVSELQPVEREASGLDSERPLILIVDDNPDILIFLQDLLSAKYNIITATDGNTGLRLAKRYVPSLVISDLMMPSIDGLELCREIKAEITTSHIPVLILTACKLDEQRVQSYESGADSYISKPFSAKVLTSRVENLLAGRKRINDLYSSLDRNNAHAEDNSRDLPATNDPHEVESRFYREFLDKVMQRYKDSELSVKDIAEALGMGSTQLSRKIKALTSLTPVDIIRNIRVREARKLILTTEMSISEIAYEVGFSSPQYFSKCFRDEYSVTPSDLRQTSGPKYKK